MLLASLLARLGSPLVVLTMLASLAMPATAAADPNDPLYPQQGNLRHLHVPQALAALARPLQPAIIAIPDTGISSTNPDLGPSLWSNPTAVPAPEPAFVNTTPMVPVGAHGWNSLGTNANNVPPSDGTPGDANTDPPGMGAADYNVANNHGTYIAGIAGAAANNGVGLTGIAPNGQLMALRTCWEDDNCYQSINAPAFNWASARGARVISMSWDWADTPAGVEPSIVAAIRNNPSTLFVGVASNGSGNYDQMKNNFGYYPCALNIPGDPAAGGSLPNFLCTTATSDAGLCGFTGQDVDLASYVDQGFTTLPAFQGDGFTPLGCSTSASATTVDGVAAILFGLDPQATGAQVKNWLVAGTTADASLSGLVASGGQLDALGAVTRLEGDLWTPTLTAPSVSAVTSTTAHISGTADSRGITGEQVTATAAAPGRPTATAPLNPDGSYALDLSGLPAGSSIPVTVTVFADGAGAPSWITPASHVLQAQQTLTVSLSNSATAPTTVTGATLPTIATGAISVSGTTATVELLCKGVSGQSCGGSATLTSGERLRGTKPLAISARKKKRAKIRTARIIDASTNYTAKAGQTTAITLTLNDAARKLLKRFHRLPTTLAVAGKTVDTVVFNAKKKRARKRKH